METLDKVFLVVFARCRRKLGNSNVESAWRRASNGVSAYVAWPVVAGVIVLAVLVYSFMQTGSHVTHKRTVQIVGVIAGILTALLLDRRFRKYLSNPPPLASEESRSERRLVFRFRAISIAVFILTCLIGFLLHRAGFHFIQGF
jgi:cytochrome b561